MPDDFTANTDTSGFVAVGGTSRGDIEEGGDVDWFAVALEAGNTYRIDLEGSLTRQGTNYDPHLRGIYDSHGRLLSGTANADGGVGLNSRVLFTPEADGTYYIAAAGAGASSGGSSLGIPYTIDAATGTYRVSATQVGVPDDHSADTGTTGRVAVGGSATGEIEERYDRDWFAVTLEAGATYRIDLEGSPTGRGTLRDTYLRGIYDSDGDQQSGTRNDDGGMGYNSRVVFTPETDGTYYVAVGAYGIGMGTYRVAVTQVSGADDHSADTGTTGRVAVGGSATGEIEEGYDGDWFAVTLEAGATYRIDLEGSSTDRGTLGDAYLRGIYDSNGNRQSGTTDDDGGVGLNSREFFTPDAGGTYYVAAGAYGAGLGTYRVAVTQVRGADDHSADTGTTGRVAVGGSATGEIEERYDRDWFAVTLEAGATYRIDLEGSPTGRGTLRDTYLRGIYDSDGDRQNGTRNDDGGVGLNSRVLFTPEADGTYYVAAGAYSTNVGTYEVSVEEVI